MTHPTTSSALRLGRVSPSTPWGGCARRAASVIWRAAARHGRFESSAQPERVRVVARSRRRGRCMRHESYRHLELDEALARGAHDPTTPRDYARAADELAIVLETCFRASDKATAAAMYESALLAARLSSGVDTAAQADAAERVRRAACAVLPAQRRAAFEAAFKRASVERASREARRVRGARARRRPRPRHRRRRPSRDALDRRAPRTARPRASGVRVHRLARRGRARGEMLATPRRGRLRPSRCRRLAEQSEAGASWARMYVAARRRWPSAAPPNARAARDATRVTASDGPPHPRALCVGRASLTSSESRSCRLVRPAGAPGTSARAETTREGRLVRRLVRHVVRKFGQRERRGRGRTEAPATSAVERAGRGEVLGRRTVRVVVQQTSLRGYGKSKESDEVRANRNQTPATCPPL